MCGGETKPHKEKKTPRPSITVPPNFPGSVTISPGETPYPETGGGEEGPEQNIGGGNFPGDVPPLDLAPGQDQQQQLPTIPSTVPGRGPTQTTPPQIVTPAPTPGPGKAVGTSRPSQNFNANQGFMRKPMTVDYLIKRVMSELD